ncbi:MAG TPA: putative transporter [Bacteroidales bacterium]|nr:putative transporter [Bacteroidales bacterium]
MQWLIDLFTSSSVAHSIMLLAITIALGIQLGKLKIANISFGIAWILFVGIALSHFGLRVDEEVLHFTKEFGLILFVYSIGLQVGPGFFSSLKKGGLRLNMLAAMIVLLGVVTTYVIHIITGTDLATMVGVLSGAVTNTPGLGAAQQTFHDIYGSNNPNIASGYAVAYPLGVIGIIISPMIIKFFCKIKLEKEAIKDQEQLSENATKRLSILVKNQGVDGHTVEEIIKILGKNVIISRIKRSDNSVEIVTNNTLISVNDTLRIITEASNVNAVVMFLGEECIVDEQQWEGEKKNLVSRRIVVTKHNLNGEKIGNLKIRSLYGVSITRINRSGIELIATFDLKLQMGDRVTCVGSEEAIAKVADLLGNSMNRLNHPNLIPIFLGVFLGIIVGSIPFAFPGLPQPVKLGLAGGPLIVAILMGRYGPYYKMVTFTTTSANMMIREIGISLFLASVGLSAGENFIETITNGGYMWVIYGLIITILPLLLVGLFARLKYKMDYYTLLGLLSGSMTDPPALAFANSVSPNDSPAVAYATVYPLTMFLRVLTAQVLIIMSL